MGRKAKPVDLDKLLFCNDIIADAVEYLIEDEISSNSYNRKSSEHKRRRELNDQYTNLFSQKDLSFFEFTQIDRMLQSCTAKERLRVFRLVIYLLKEKIISDIKLERLIVFEHRFTTQGASYTDFVYLMNSEIYSDFVYHQEDLTNSEASDLFFAHVSFDLYNDEIATITQEWCEQMKINFKYTILVRRSKIFMIEASNPVPTPLLGHRCRSSQEITGSPTPFSTSNHYLWICASASFSLSNPNIAA